MRKIIALTDAQVAWIRKQADKLGISETEVIRRLVDKAKGIA